ncbi:hypothetical protein PG989_010495 [Apiospora arundinis]
MDTAPDRGFPLEDHHNLGGDDSSPDLEDRSSGNECIYPQVKNLHQSEDLDKRMAQHSIVHHRWKQGKTLDWISYSITLRGEALKTLAVVLEGYPGIDTSVEEFVLHKPHKPVLHRWEAFKELRDTVEDPKHRENATVLISVFDGAMSASGDVITTLNKTGRIECDKLDLAFSLGEIVVLNSFGVTSAHYLIDFDEDKDGWTADLECIDWNGSHFGRRTTSVQIPWYDGEKRIDSLDLCPLKWHKDRESLEALLVARGRKFEALRGYHFMHCDGASYHDHSAGNFPARGGKPVHGRVVIDAHAYYECQGMTKPGWERLDPGSSMMPQSPTSIARRQTHRDSPSYEEHADFRREILNRAVAAATAAASPVYGDNKLQQSGLGNMLKKAQDVKAQRNIVDQPVLSEEQCMVTHTHVKGMDLSKREWGVFYVEDLADIEWRPEIFKRLVLQEGVKEMALTAIKHKQEANVDIDVVPGKGRGLLLLTFGPPGTGKTMTAEAVAEECHLLLFSKSAGDLGSNTAFVEKALDMAFQCCTLWNAVMLLDEADVFLAKRTLEGLQRNELVSIFLRKLEHYQGILFLTTNRMESIDAAFQSRIDLMLPFDPLTREARHDRFGVYPEELEELAAMDLNGREIKNLVKMALVLHVAEDKGQGADNNTKVIGGNLLKLAKMRIRAQQLLKE